MTDKVSDILAKYGESAAESTWAVQGQRVIRHACLERIAAQAGISFDPPVILRAERDEAVILVTGRLPDVFADDHEARESTVVMSGRFEWSIGEALIGVNYRVSGKQAAYVWAMAEKRAKDRVILKLIELHGLLYSEDEADDFKAGPRVPDDLKIDEAQTRKPGTITVNGERIPSNGNNVSAYRARKDGRWEPLVAALRACPTIEALNKWLEDHEADFEQLPEGWLVELREEFAARKYAIKSGH